MRGDLADAGGDEALEALVDLAAAEPHRDAVVEIEFPGAARIEPDRGQAHARFDELALRGEIAARDLASVPRGPDSRGSSGGMCRASEMNSSPRVFSRPFAPQRAAATCSVTRMLSARGHWRSTRRAIYPGKLLDRAPHGGEVHADEAHVAHARLDGLLDFDRPRRAGSGRSPPPA